MAVSFVTDFLPKISDIYRNNRKLRIFLIAYMLSKVPRYFPTRLAMWQKLIVDFWVNFHVRVWAILLLAITQLCDTLVLFYVQVSDAGTFYTSAVTTSGEVRCEIPVFPLDSNTTLQLYNWTVYLSADNTKWSNGTQVLVYDPVCVACNVTANNDTENETALTCLPSQVNLAVVV